MKNFRNISRTKNDNLNKIKESGRNTWLGQNNSIQL